MNIPLQHYKTMAEQAYCGNMGTGETAYLVNKQGVLGLVRQKSGEKLTLKTGAKEMTDNVNLRMNLLEKIRETLVEGADGVEEFLHDVRETLLGKEKSEEELSKMTAQERVALNKERLNDLGQKLEAETVRNVFEKLKNFTAEHKDSVVKDDVAIKDDVVFKDYVVNKGNVVKVSEKGAGDATKVFSTVNAFLTNPENVITLEQSEALGNLSPETVGKLLGHDMTAEGYSLKFSDFKMVHEGKFVQFAAETGDGLKTAVLIGTDGSLGTRASFNILRREVKDLNQLNGLLGKIKNMKELDSLAEEIGKARQKMREDENYSYSISELLERVQTIPLKSAKKVVKKGSKNKTNKTDKTEPKKLVKTDKTEKYRINPTRNDVIRVQLKPNGRKWW